MKTKYIIKAKQVLSDECGYASPGIMEMDDEVTAEEALTAMIEFAEQYLEGMVESISNDEIKKHIPYPKSISTGQMWKNVGFIRGAWYFKKRLLETQ